MGKLREKVGSTWEMGREQCSGKQLGSGLGSN